MTLRLRERFEPFKLYTGPVSESNILILSRFYSLIQDPSKHPNKSSPKGYLRLIKNGFDIALRMYPSFVWYLKWIVCTSSNPPIILWMLFLSQMTDKRKRKLGVAIETAWIPFSMADPTRASLITSFARGQYSGGNRWTCETGFAFFAVQLDTWTKGRACVLSAPSKRDIFMMLFPFLGNG